jgi:hypothetical protein
MKQKRTTRSVNVTMIMASAIALALALIIVPKQAMAVDCLNPTPTASTDDSDGDGFTDAQECAGIILLGDNGFGGVLGATIPTCTPGIERSLCVDPNSRDAFVIVTRATPTKIPSLNPYLFTSAPQSAGGLGITIHEISTSRADRLVTGSSKQLAARLRESLDTSDVILGSANQGIALDLATVFTQRIANFVNSVCDPTKITMCVDSNSLTNSVDTPAEVIEHYIRHTIAHELGGHVLTLAPVYNSRFGGNHYQSGTNVVMEQTVTYTNKNGKVTWYISTLYTDPDRAGVKLK